MAIRKRYGALLAAGLVFSLAGAAMASEPISPDEPEAPLAGVLSMGSCLSLAEKRSTVEEALDVVWLSAEETCRQLLMPRPQGIATAELEAVAALYAERYRVSRDEAEDRLLAQIDLGETPGQIRLLAGDRYLQIMLQHEPEFLLNVRLTEGPALPDVEALLEQAAFPYRLSYDAPYSHDDMLRVVHEYGEALLSTYPEILNFSTVEADERIEVLVRGTEDELQTVERMVREVIGDTPVVLAFVGGPDVDLAPADRGGRIMATCTSGFSAKYTDSTSRRLLTAGHCSNSQWWAWFSSPSVHYGATWNGEFADSYRDFQWHTLDASFPPQPQYYGSGTTPGTQIQVLGTTSRASAMGHYVCHRGKTTGWSCGQIVSINYNYNAHAYPSPRSSTWIRTNNISCAGGDSGGPLAIGNGAYGIFSGRIYNDSNPCLGGISMSTDYLATAGLSVVFY